MPARVIFWIVLALTAIVAGMVLLALLDEEPTVVGAGTQSVASPADPAPQVPPADVPAELAGAVAAFAAARSPVIPVADGLGVLATVTATDGLVTFVFDVEIDGAAYDLEGERAALMGGLAAVACDDGTCFEVEASIVEEACADAELAALLRLGATVAYLYRDTAGRELGAISISSANCPA